MIHGGDFTYTGKPPAVEKFNDWLGRLPHKHKVVIAGNHDVTFHAEYYHTKYRRYHDQRFPSQKTKNSLTNCIYLEDGEVTVEGVRIYGSPWQPEFCDWAFNLSGSEALKEKWDLIPTGIDILVTHGPPFGFGGICLPRREDAGCYELLQAIKRTRPIIHVAGHIHEGYGAASDNGVAYVNASSVNQKYALTNRAVVIDITAGEDNTNPIVT
uniref:Calcineurin-like phosphoesterase domain-containing protein n=1 Tax=Arcella intermedia TaxID=1963864 RepID=A0A6B2LFP3_9EUKA